MATEDENTTSTETTPEATPATEQTTDAPANGASAENQQPTDGSNESTTTGDEATPAEAPESTEAPDSDSAEPAADESVQLTISIEMMLYEAGMIANSLSSKSLGAALADRLYDEEQVAEGKQESRFSFEFTPFEAGMALSAISRSADSSLDELQGRLGQALVEKMDELGIPPIPDQGGGAVGGGL